jgi:hypothetical protein
VGCISSDEPTMGVEVCVENKAREIYNGNIFKKKVDSQGNAMEFHKDRDCMNDNEILPMKA